MGSGLFLAQAAVAHALLQADSLHGGPWAAPDTLEAAILLQRQGSVLSYPAAQAPPATVIYHQHQAASSMRPTADSAAEDSRGAITVGPAHAAEHSSVHNGHQPPQGPGSIEQQAGHTQSAERERAPAEDDSKVLSKGEFQQPDIGTPSFPANFQVAGNSHGVDAKAALEESKVGQHQQEKADTVESPGCVRGRQETADWRQEQRLWLTSPSGLSETAGLQLRPESAASTAPPSRAESRTSLGGQPGSLEGRRGRSQRPAKVGLPPCSLAKYQHPRDQAKYEGRRRACRPRLSAATSASVESLPQALQLISCSLLTRKMSVWIQHAARSAIVGPVMVPRSVMHDACSCR